MTDARVRAAQRAVGLPGGVELETPATGPPEYVGLVTRGVALTIDAALLNLVAVVVGAAIALLMTTLSVPGDVETLVALASGFVYAGWVVLYFVAFWCVDAQTLGDRVMGIRVQHPDGRRIRPGRALVRFGALVLCAIPLGAGFIPVLYDRRRRGLHDRIARTVVVVGEGDRPRRGRLLPIIETDDQERG